MSGKSCAGRIGEEIAALFLTLKGYEIVGRNVRTRRSEIDIVARKGGCLVFVEVKLRGPGSLSDARESLDRRKRERISRGSLSFLQNCPRNSYRTARIDLIAITWSGNELVLNHIENAFPAEGTASW